MVNNDVFNNLQHQEEHLDNFQDERRHFYTSTPISEPPIDVSLQHCSRSEETSSSQLQCDNESYTAAPYTLKATNSFSSQATPETSIKRPDSEDLDIPSSEDVSDDNSEADFSENFGQHASSIRVSSPNMERSSSSEPYSTTEASSGLQSSRGYATSTSHLDTRHIDNMCGSTKHNDGPVAVSHKVPVRKTLFTIDSIIGTPTGGDTEEKQNKADENVFTNSQEVSDDTFSTSDDISPSAKKDVFDTIPSPPPKITEFQPKTTPQQREVTPFVNFSPAFSQYARPAMHANPHAGYNPAAIFRNNYYSQLLSGMAPHGNFINTPSLFNSPQNTSIPRPGSVPINPYLVQAAVAAAAGNIQPQSVDVNNYLMTTNQSLWSRNGASPRKGSDNE